MASVLPIMNRLFRKVPLLQWLSVCQATAAAFSVLSSLRPIYLSPFTRCNARQKRNSTLTTLPLLPFFSQLGIPNIQPKSWLFPTICGPPPLWHLARPSRIELHFHWDVASAGDDVGGHYFKWIFLKRKINVSNVFCSVVVVRWPNYTRVIYQFIDLTKFESYVCTSILKSRFS